MEEEGTAWGHIPFKADQESLWFKALSLFPTETIRRAPPSIPKKRRKRQGDNRRLIQPSDVRGVKRAYIRC